MFTYLEPAHVKEELKKGEEREIHVTDEPPLCRAEVLPPHQARQEKHIYRDCHDLYTIKQLFLL